MVKQAAHPLPGKPGFLTAPPHRPIPEPTNPEAEHAECAGVRGHPVVAQVPTHNRAQPASHLWDRIVQAPPKLGLHLPRLPEHRWVVDVVQERGEPQRPIPPRCLTYPLQRTVHAILPARCPGRVLLVRIPFGQAPSLHPLRGWGAAGRRVRRCSLGCVRRFRLRARVGFTIAAPPAAAPVLVRGSLALRRMTLPFTTPCRFLPAHRR